MTDANFIINPLKARTYLRPPQDQYSGIPAQVGQNLTLQEQPDYPSALRITITTTSEATSGNIYISGFGTDPNGPEIIDWPMAISQGPNETVTYETSTLWTHIPEDNIQTAELARSSDIFIHIKDKPMSYIYAVGTPTGVPYFRAEMNPMYEPLCHEMLIAVVETDENSIIHIQDYSVGALEPIVERLIPACDGVTRVFYQASLPKPGTDSVFNDGIRMFQGMPFGKGYIMDGKKITLEANVPTPDANTLLIAVYRRFT